MNSAHLDSAPRAPNLTLDEGRRGEPRRDRRGYRVLDRVLALDIETIPDGELVDTSAGKFPKTIFHRIVAIAYTLARIVRHEDGTESYIVERCASGGDPTWGEAELVAGFWRFFAAGSYRLVTWNGAAFDMPVLRLRAMVHGIAIPAWYTRGDRWTGYTARFSDISHADVMRCLSDYGATTSLGLDETARALGLPGKVGGDGAGVADLVAAGRLDDVRAYCECDTLGTYVAFLRFMHLSGRCTDRGHDASVDALVRYLSEERARRPHLGTFLDRWSRKRVGRPLAGARNPPAGASAP